MFSKKEEIVVMAIIEKQIYDLKGVILKKWDEMGDMEGAKEVLRSGRLSYEESIKNKLGWLAGGLTGHVLRNLLTAFGVSPMEPICLGPERYFLPAFALMMAKKENTSLAQFISAVLTGVQLNGDKTFNDREGVERFIYKFLV